MSAEFLECVPCNKVFTGRQCLMQHLESAKHIKRMKLAPENSAVVLPAKETSVDVNSGGNVEHKNLPVGDGLPNTSVPSASRTVLQCVPCKVFFQTADEYMSHIATQDHVDAVRKFILLTGAPPPELPICSFEAPVSQLNSKNDGNIKQLAPKGEDYQSSNPGNGKCARQPTSPLSNVFHCDVCEIFCYGIVPFKAHLSGEKHLKKMRQRGTSNDATADSNKTPSLALSTTASVSSALCVPPTVINVKTCEACGISCSGDVPFEQHLKGERHRKRIARFKPENIPTHVELRTVEDINQSSASESQPEVSSEEKVLGKECDVSETVKVSCARFQECDSLQTSDDDFGGFDLDSDSKSWEYDSDYSV